MAFLGADVQALLACARRMDQHGSRLREIADELAARVGAATWIGADAESFRERVDAQARTGLDDAAVRLSGRGASVGRGPRSGPPRANRVRLPSEGTGLPPQPLRSPQPPVAPLGERCGTDAEQCAGEGEASRRPVRTALGSRRRRLPQRCPGARQRDATDPARLRGPVPRARRILERPRPTGLSPRSSRMTRSRPGESRGSEQR